MAGAVSLTASNSILDNLQHRITEAIGKVPADAWTPAYDGDGEARDGAWVADITGLLDLDRWPGAQLRFKTSTGAGSPASPPT